MSKAGQSRLFKRQVRGGREPEIRFINNGNQIIVDSVPIINRLRDKFTEHSLKSSLSIDEIQIKNNLTSKTCNLPNKELFPGLRFVS